MRHWLLIGISLLAALSGACSSLQPALPHPDIDPVVLVVSQAPPRFIATGVPDKQMAAAGGGGAFFLQCAALTPLAGGPAAVVSLAWLAGCTVAAPVAGAVYASRAPSAEELMRSRDLAAVKAMQQSSKALHGAILAAAEQVVPGRVLTADDSSGVGELRVALESIELRGDTRTSRSNPPIQLIVSVTVSLVAHDGTTVRVLTVSYVAGPYTLAEWTDKDAARLQVAIAGALEPVAEAVVDAAFLLCPLPYRGTVPWSTDFAGLQAEAPRTSGDVFHPGAPVAESLRPTFKWESFPRGVDRGAAPSIEHAREVSYDLILMQQVDGVPINVVRRNGLSTNSLSLDGDLTPGQTYYWSVRARYTEGKRRCVTEWSARWEPSVAAPGAMGFVFRTPAAK